MKNKFVKFLNLGICCIMFSALIATCIPQTDTLALNSNPIQKSGARILTDDPPFH